jgi:hypothetical protein
VPWEIEFTDEFREWWDALSQEGRKAFADRLGYCGREARHCNLPIPRALSLRHGHMRELRIQHRGRPYRVLFAFDPLRIAILLIGGDKTGNDRWYGEYVPVADRLYDEHLRELKDEGRI